MGSKVIGYWSEVLISHRLVVAGNDATTASASGGAILSRSERATWTIDGRRCGKVEQSRQQAGGVKEDDMGWQETISAKPGPRVPRLGYVHSRGIIPRMGSLFHQAHFAARQAAAPARTRENGSTVAQRQ